MLLHLDVHLVFELYLICDKQENADSRVSFPVQK